MKNLVKYNKLADKGMNNFFDNFFNRNITDFFGSDFMLQAPSINIVEDENNYRVELAAPGLNKEDFEINVESGYLKIAARKENEETVEEDNYLRREFNYTTFQRSFQLPDSVDVNNIGANYKNGVLVLTLPKLEEAKAKPVKVIEIK
jgi:HSP20 family protein